MTPNIDNVPDRIIGILERSLGFKFNANFRKPLSEIIEIEINEKKLSDQVIYENLIREIKKFNSNSEIDTKQ